MVSKTSSGMSHARHRSQVFHGYGMLRRPDPRWQVERRYVRIGPLQIEPMFESIAECMAWQKRTRFGRNRSA